MKAVGSAQSAGERAGVDAEAVHAVWHAHRRWVAAILLAHMPRNAELEDLLQEVAMALVKNMDKLNDPSAVRPWLRTVAVNIARTAGRKHTIRKRVTPMVAADPSREPGGEPEPGERQAAREEGMRAMEIARHLPEEYREPLLLRAVRGMSYRQIADVLSVPITTIETRLTRARRMIREQMELEPQRIPGGPAAAGGKQP
jgi:RNA polymerase sigma-70 factor (ECF subfamily)